MQNFELIYQGPLNSSPETLRNIKAAFLTELSLDVDQIKKILDSAPSTVMNSESELDLLISMEILSQAGAKVAINERAVEKSPEPTLSAIQLEEEADFLNAINKISEKIPDDGLNGGASAICSKEEPIPLKIAPLIPSKIMAPPIPVGGLAKKSSVLVNDGPESSAGLAKQAHGTLAARKSRSVRNSGSHASLAISLPMLSAGDALTTLIFSLILALSVFMGGNWLYISMHNKARSEEMIDRLLNIVLMGSEGLSADPYEEKIQNSEYRTFSGANNIEGTEINSRFIFNDNELFSMLIHMRPPLPDSMSPEQIVEGDEPPITVYNVVIGNVAIKNLDDGKFEARGPAKLFIERNGNRERVIATASIEGQFIPSESKIRANLVVNKGYDAEPMEDVPIIEGSRELGYKVFMKTILSSKLIAAKR